MRNLQQVRHDLVHKEDLASLCFRGEDVVSLTIKAGIARIYLSIDESCFAEFDVPNLEPDLCDRVIDMHYNEVDDDICLIMYGGDIVIVHLGASTDGSEELVEILGTIDERVQAAHWSPDNELLAIATKNTLSLLTQQFDSIAKIDIANADVKLSSTQVSVGWGRAETQFRGKKAARDPTLPETVDSGKLSELDRGQISLSWRGDASYVCMSKINNSRRVIWVYSRDGLLESTSEPVDDQLDFVTWKPDGSLVTTAKKQATSNQAIFFEKNGLRHGEFDLRTDADILDMRWNCDSTTLAVLYANCLDLWTSGNYHYYLKQRINLPSSGHIRWHNEQALRIIWSSRTSYLDLDFQWQVATHEICEPHDFGVVAVMDGQVLKLTPLRIANVPPPMAFLELSLPAVPRGVHISRHADQIIVLFDTSLQIYTWNLVPRPIKMPLLDNTCELSLLKDEAVLQVVQDQQGCISILTSFARILNAQGTEAIDRATYAIKDIIESMDVRSIHPCADGILAQDSKGQLINLRDCSTTLQTQVKVPVFETVAWCAETDDRPGHLIGLTKGGNLYVDGRSIRTKVTSFILIGHILAYTRSVDLNFIDLSNELELDDAQVSTNERTIERGSLLICACPSVQSLTIQAPRGNLETIFPRQFVLAGIQRSIVANDWARAWRLSKVHRIDPNFLHDYMPELFLSNLSSVIAGFGTSSELDIFLTALKSENVCVTMYEGLAKAASEFPQQANADKVNNICDAVLGILKQDRAESHLSSILTAQLSRRPPDYPAALSLASSLPQDKKEIAVTHLCFLADPHLLYKESLALYDLRSALQFAQKSQKDPREYIPFLQNIQTMSMHRQRFTIDDHLGYFSKAVQSLLELEDAWDESTAYIARHALWQPALHQLRYKTDLYNKLLALYAEHLLSIQSFADAGFAFEQVGDHAQAASAFEGASYWTEALHNANMAGLPLEDIARRLKEQLADQSRFAEAAEIARNQLHDKDSAISLYCRAYKFSDAMFIASTPEKITQSVRPMAVEAFSQMSELLSEMRTQLSKQVPRLQEVRAKRELNPQDYLDQDGDDDAPDNVSLADTQGTTNASFFTRYTGASAMTTQSKKSGKARRRQERQRAKGKKGTIWEEEYLVNSIRRMIERLQSDIKDIQSLIVALVRCNLRENASELQNATLNLVAELNKRMDEVFVATDGLPEELRRLTLSKPVVPTLQPFQLC